MFLKTTHNVDLNRESRHHPALASLPGRSEFLLIPGDAKAFTLSSIFVTLLICNTKFKINKLKC